MLFWHVIPSTAFRTTIYVIMVIERLAKNFRTHRFAIVPVAFSLAWVHDAILVCSTLSSVYGHDSGHVVSRRSVFLLPRCLPFIFSVVLRWQSPWSLRSGPNEKPPPPQLANEIIINYLRGFSRVFKNIAWKTTRKFDGQHNRADVFSD